MIYTEFFTQNFLHPQTRGSFPSEEACLKLLYLGLKNVAKKWTMPIPDWGLAMNQFAIMFPERINLA
jgi:putative transposase